jgi:hypothetical protein
LVRRKGEPEPKARYIALAAVRSLAQVVPKLFESVQRPFVPGVFPASAKGRACDLLERIFNQNEQALGLFFLHADGAVDIWEHAVAVLRVTVAVKCQHYSILTEARSGRLKEDFRAKLGWLLGNLYARPATPDWDDRKSGKEALNALVHKFVSPSPEVGPCWIDDATVAEVRSRNLPIPEGTPDEIVQKLKDVRPPTPREIGLDEIVAELRQALPCLDDDRLEKVRRNLRNNSKLTQQFRK